MGYYMIFDFSNLYNIVMVITKSGAASVIATIEHKLFGVSANVTKFAINTRPKNGATFCPPKLFTQNIRMMR